jgi:hypothetical protein
VVDAQREKGKGSQVSISVGYVGERRGKGKNSVQGSKMEEMEEEEGNDTS